jgi:hypothetical protein
VTSHMQRLVASMMVELADMRTEPPLLPRILIIRVVPWRTCMSTSALDQQRRSECLRQNALMVALGSSAWGGGQRRCCFAPQLPLFVSPTIAASMEAMRSAATTGSHGGDGGANDVTLSKEWQHDAVMLQRWASAKADGSVLLLTVPDRIDLVTNHLQRQHSPHSPSVAQSPRSMYDPAEEAAEVALAVRALTCAMNADGIIVIEDDVVSSLAERPGRWATTHILPFVELRRVLSSRPPTLISVCSELLLKFPTTSDLSTVRDLLWDRVQFSLPTEERQPTSTTTRSVVKSETPDDENLNSSEHVSFNNHLMMADGNITPTATTMTTLRVFHQMEQSDASTH